MLRSSNPIQCIASASSKCYTLSNAFLTSMKHTKTGF